MGTRALEANGHLWGRSVPSVLCPFPPKFFQIGIWGKCPKCPFTLVHILPQCSFGRNGHKAFMVPLSPESPLFPKTPSANFPLCPFAKIFGEWAQGTWGTPSGHLGYPLPSNPLLPHCPFAKI